MRDADHRRAQRFELVGGLGEVVSFDGAAGGKGRRVKIQHHRTGLQRVGQRECKRLAGEGRLCGEIRCLNAWRKCRVQGRGECRTAQGKNHKTLHGKTSFGAELARWAVCAIAVLRAIKPQITAVFAPNSSAPWTSSTVHDGYFNIALISLTTRPTSSSLMAGNKGNVTVSPPTLATTAVSSSRKPASR